MTVTDHGPPEATTTPAWSGITRRLAQDARDAIAAGAARLR